MTSYSSWRPATIEDVNLVVQVDLLSCNPAEKEAFRRYAVDAYEAPLFRYGKLESVVVVARRGNEVIYWEDVEEGFNVSPRNPDGFVREHYCNQDTLPMAIRSWL